MSHEQVKSKQRVADHGEVFTSEREVNAMLDLVKNETERIDSRFLEPACGTGNFLSEILRRKLDIVTQKYKSSLPEWEKYAVLAVSSVYGIDILRDNVEECRHRLFDIFDSYYRTLFDHQCRESCRKTVKLLLRKNILWGDALSLRIPDTQHEPIIFSEWSLFDNSKLTRRDFTLADLMELDLGQYNKHTYRENELPMFSDTGDKAFIPEPFAVYQPVHYLEIGEKYDNELQS